MPLYPSWDYKETKQKIGSIQDPDLREYARVHYLLGGRITEILTLTPGKISVKNGVIFAEVNSLKTRRGKNIFRNLPNIYSEEKYYTTALYRFYKHADKDKKFYEYIGIGGKRSIEIKMKKELGVVPHTFRHLRATHMGKGLIPSSIHQATALHLKYYFGWSNIAVANSYIDDLTVHDILRERTV